MNDGPGANEGEISELDFGPVEPTTNLPDGADGGVAEQIKLSDGGVSETVDALIPKPLIPAQPNRETGTLKLSTMP